MKTLVRIELVSSGSRTIDSFDRSYCVITQTSILFALVSMTRSEHQKEKRGFSVVKHHSILINIYSHLFFALFSIVDVPLMSRPFR